MSDPGVTQERIAAMMAANTAAGATSTTTPATPAADASLPADPIEVDEPEADGQPAPKEPDPWAEVKAKFTPDKIKELAEKEINFREMQSTSHQRNREAAERLRRSEESEARSNAAVQKIEAMSTAIAQLSRMNPELGAQVMASLAQDSGVPMQPAGNGFAPQPAPQRDPMVAQLQAQIAEMQKNVQGFAFNVNVGAVTSAIDRQIAAHPIFGSAEKLGELDESVQRILGKYAEMDRENPGAINPQNPRALSEAVKTLVTEEAKRLQKIRDFHVKTYREERKALNAKAPASQKGPSATVRAAPTVGKPAGRESSVERVNRWTRDFANASKRPVNGTASEI